MDLHDGHPFWLINSGLPVKYPQLKKDSDVDVVILGGGITGAIHAYYFARKGINAVVLEKRSVGLGSTCASTALLQYQIDTPLSELIEHVGEEDAVRAYELCAQSIKKTKKMCKNVGFKGFSERPTVFYASWKKDVPLVEKEYELHKKYGFEVEFLEGDMLKEQYGLDFPCAMRSQHSAVIDAYALTHKLLKYARKKAKIKTYDRTAVTNIEHGKKQVKLTTEQGNVVTAKHLVYAVGYEIVDYLEKDIVDLHSTYAIVSEQMEDVKEFWPDNALIWETKDPYLYMRTTEDNRIMLGGRDEDGYNPKLRAELMEKKQQQLADDFAKLFPEYAFTPEFFWAGTFGSTKDGLPYIGKYEKKPGGLFALGFGGNGITFSVISAKILRDLILGNENPDAQVFAFDR
ncbi:MAG: FAD-binding oxidoreductase [Weeksellaceae bacterium]|nr:FAD-binding oxidoreductase [Weeksellaceae bacterium]